MEVFLVGKIEGEFEGFDEDKVFELTNGQKWQQARYKYRYRYKYRPNIKILKDGGRYYLEVEGMDEMIEVRSIY